MLNVFDFLRSDGSIVINKKLAHTIGLEQTVIFSELVSLFYYWSNRGELVDENLQKSERARFFFCTIENLENNTTIKKDKQNKIVKELERLELIEVKKMGLPAKRFFAITDGIYKYFDNIGKPQTENRKPESPDNENKFSQNAKTDNDAGLTSDVVDTKGTETTVYGFSSCGEKRKLEAVKCETNNTITNNTNLNNNKINNLSIPMLNKVNNKELRSYLAKKSDGLTDDIILIINDLFEEELLPISDFKNVIGEVLAQSKPIKNLAKYIRASIKNYSSSQQPTTATKTVKRDTLPKWLREEQNEDNHTKPLETDKKREEEQRATFEELLRERDELKKRDKYANKNFGF